MIDRDPYQELLDESRQREAVDDRARRRWLETQLRDDAQLTAILGDLASRAADVTVRTVAGTTLHAALVAVAVDHVVLEVPGERAAYVGLDAIAAVRPDLAVDAAPAGLSTDAVLDRTLSESLALESEHAPRVRVGLRGSADPITGVLEGVGRDVLMVRLDADQRPTYVPIAVVSDVAVVS